MKSQIQTHLESLKQLNKSCPKALQFKYYTPLSMFAVVVLLACDCLVNKPVQLPIISKLLPEYGNIPASAIIYPIAYYIIDISTEVYGFYLARRIIFTLIMCNILFALLTILCINFPSPPTWKNQLPYNIVFDPLKTLWLYSTAGLAVGSFLNSIVVSKLGVMMHGKRYWIRCLIASFSGQLATCTVSYSLIFWRSHALIEIVGFIFCGTIYKSLISLIFWGPNCVLAKYIKEKEGLHSIDYNVRYKFIDFSNFNKSFKIFTKEKASEISCVEG